MSAREIIESAGGIYKGKRSFIHPRAGLITLIYFGVSDIPGIIMYMSECKIKSAEDVMKYVTQKRKELGQKPKPALDKKVVISSLLFDLTNLAAHWSHDEFRLKCAETELEFPHSKETCRRCQIDYLLDRYDLIQKESERRDL